VFTEKEKRIFRFEVNGKKYARDPVRLLRRFEAAMPSNHEQLMDDLGSGDPGKFNAACEKMIPQISGILGLKLISDTGEDNGQDVYNEDEVFDVYNQFWAFVAEKKSATEESAGNSPTTPASIPSEAESSATKTTSDCGCGETPR